MLVGWFSAYAFARTWDLTWGNRPASAEHSTKSSATRANVETELKAKAMTLCIFILMCNLLFIFLYQQLQHVQYAALALAGFIFTFACVQMFLSCIYFLLYYDPRRILQGSWRIARLPFKKRKPIIDSESEDEEDFIDNGKVANNNDITTVEQPNSLSINSTPSLKQSRSGLGSNVLVTENMKPLKVSTSRNTGTQILPSKSNDIQEKEQQQLLQQQQPHMNRNNSTRVTEIKSTKSNSVVEIKNEGLDTGEVKRSLSTHSFGKVKRTSSVANEV
jgi:heme/copper-type cytochrome/quinol oxidase subunit 4